MLICPLKDTDRKFWDCDYACANCIVLWCWNYLHDVKYFIQMVSLSNMDDRFCTLLTICVCAYLIKYEFNLAWAKQNLYLLWVQISWISHGYLNVVEYVLFNLLYYCCGLMCLALSLISNAHAYTHKICLYIWGEATEERVRYRLAELL